MTHFNDAFLRACKCEPTSHIPVWFMRQAGRYQPEYRAMRERYSIKDICKIPEVCTEVTLLPVQQLGVDAAILFSDIVIPLEPMGVQVDFHEGVGPVIGNPVRTASDVDALTVVAPEETLSFVGDAVQMLSRTLTVPLIGFTGAPFTLACYLIEGRASKDFAKARSMMYAEPHAWHLLMEKLASMMLQHLLFQVRSGAGVVQLFDSWVGNLSVEDFREYVLPHMQRIFAELRAHDVPSIYFGVMTGHLLEAMREAGSDVVGVDWRTPMDEAWRRVGFDRAVQGNLDPAVLFAPTPIVEQKTRSILRRSGHRNGFIFNLGHGVLPTTDGGVLRHIVELVHAYTRVATHA